MQISKQVTSLDVSKRLKELGVRQESYFGWMKEPVGEEHGSTNSYWLSMSDDKKTFEIASTFTVAELGEILPRTVDGYPLTCIKMHGWDWSVSYEVKSDESVKQAPTEADARGLMLIHLLERGIIKP